MRGHKIKKLEKENDINFISDDELRTEKAIINKGLYSQFMKQEK